MMMRPADVEKTMGKNIRHCLQVYTKYRQSAEIWKGQKAGTR